MDIDAHATLAVPVDRVYGAVADLTTYPEWLSIVEGVTVADPHPDDPGGPAYLADLVGKFGPLALRKRVRMVRTVADGRGVRFERHEHDGETHAGWVLSGEVEGDGHTARVRVHLWYGGLPTVPGLDTLLRDEGRRAGERLERLLLDRSS